MQSSPRCNSVKRVTREEAFAEWLGVHGPSLPAGEAERTCRQRMVNVELPPTQYAETHTPSAPLVTDTHEQSTVRDTPA